MEAGVGVERVNKKGKVPGVFRSNNDEGRYMLVVHDKELEDKRDSDISTNTLRIA